jgi:hypothetical protein
LSLDSEEGGFRWKTEYKPHSIALNTSSATTVLMGDSEVAVLTVTGITFEIGKSVEAMAQIAQGVHGLTSGPPTPAASP